uniref:Uncharacterized protein n=1 Tax=Chromera velia CCMP2878 TaxID=1169474 RepID=A0A0G4GXW2_9ALVE|eukprot:Cvel_23794.t1-p1 / transcript=Cvel_23794.t1 / gene=Cvel_23794 / organism=Chromera_velia_CCMP2878 / gene_product=hypothetical protein / transcript_product=hypothetical protein / location=Cvel_scaffold2497:20598-27215(+) / protein_length=868 / sequence_SO=supercontig / SO=protein_coding / is_pseudo=false
MRHRRRLSFSSSFVGILFTFAVALLKCSTAQTTDHEPSPNFLASHPAEHETRQQQHRPADPLSANAGYLAPQAAMLGFLQTDATNVQQAGGTQQGQQGQAVKKEGQKQRDHPDEPGLQGTDPLVPTGPFTEETNPCPGNDVDTSVVDCPQMKPKSETDTGEGQTVGDYGNFNMTGLQTEKLERITPMNHLTDMSDEMLVANASDSSGGSNATDVVGLTSFVQQKTTQAQRQSPDEETKGEVEPADLPNIQTLVSGPQQDIATPPPPEEEKNVTAHVAEPPTVEKNEVEQVTPENAFQDYDDFQGNGTLAPSPPVNATEESINATAAFMERHAKRIQEAHAKHANAMAKHQKREKGKRKGKDPDADLATLVVYNETDGQWYTQEGENTGHTNDSLTLENQVEEPEFNRTTPINVIPRNEELPPLNETFNGTLGANATASPTGAGAPPEGVSPSFVETPPEVKRAIEEEHRKRQQELDKSARRHSSGIRAHGSAPAEQEATAQLLQRVETAGVIGKALGKFSPPSPGGKHDTPLASFVELGSTNKKRALTEDKSVSRSSNKKPETARVTVDADGETRTVESHHSVGSSTLSLSSVVDSETTTTTTVVTTTTTTIPYDANEECAANVQCSVEGLTTLQEPEAAPCLSLAYMPISWIVHAAQADSPVKHFEGQYRRVSVSVDTEGKLGTFSAFYCKDGISASDELDRVSGCGHSRDAPGFTLSVGTCSRCEGHAEKCLLVSEWKMFRRTQAVATLEVQDKVKPITEESFGVTIGSLTEGSSAMGVSHGPFEMTFSRRTDGCRDWSAENALGDSVVIPRTGTCSYFTACQTAAGRRGLESAVEGGEEGIQEGGGGSRDGRHNSEESGDTHHAR